LGVPEQPFQGPSGASNRPPLDHSGGKYVQPKRYGQGALVLREPSQNPRDLWYYQKLSFRRF
jgi:hypothetical protein